MADEEQAKEEARARRAQERAERDHMKALRADAPDVPKEVLEEQHLLSDVVSSAPGLLGVPSEVVAGAASNAGWEMTQAVSLDQVKREVATFLSQPA